MWAGRGKQNSGSNAFWGVETKVLVFKKRQFNILQLQKGNENRTFYSHPNK